MPAKSEKQSKLYVAAFDVHYPEVNKKTFRALLAFMEQNDVDGFIFGGDQRNNEEISPHTKKQPKRRQLAGAHIKNTKKFDKDIMQEVEKRLKPDAEKVYILGNHDDWETQLIDEKPELEGMQTHEMLNLAERGWNIIDTGKAFTKGKLTVIHGETLSGANHSKKAVELYVSNILYGHFHAPQSATKILPHDKKEKWMSWCAPIVGETNPYYLRNAPTAWMNGFVIIEFMPNGHFNLYPVIVFNGEFSFGGKVYKG